jgi:hypothetical protein
MTATQTRKPPRRNCQRRRRDRREASTADVATSVFTSGLPNPGHRARQRSLRNWRSCLPRSLLVLFSTISVSAATEACSFLKRKLRIPAIARSSCETVRRIFGWGKKPYAMAMGSRCGSQWFPSRLLDMLQTEPFAAVHLYKITHFGLTLMKDAVQQIACRESEAAPSRRSHNAWSKSHVRSFFREV